VAQASNTLLRQVQELLMFSPNLVAKFAAAALFAAVLVLPGCSINVKDKNKDGEAKVDIKSPFGDIHVNEQPDIKESGLSLYPGATPAPKDNDGDKKSANVNIAVPGFTLKVVAAEFQSGDSPEKVLSYYRQDLKHFGNVLECHGAWTGGDVDAKAGKDVESKPVSCKSSSDGDSVELKVGTEGDQHIVAVKPNGKGSHFALVYVRAHAGKSETI